MYRKKSTWLILTAVILLIVTAVIIALTWKTPDTAPLAIEHIDGDWGRNPIVSYLQDQPSVTIEFKDEPNGNDYKFIGTPSEMASLYISYEAFEERYNNATNAMWSRYRLSTKEMIIQAVKSANPDMDDIKELATQQHVMQEATSTNDGLYHMQFTTSDASWKNTMTTLIEKTGSSTVLLPVAITLESVRCYGLVKVEMKDNMYTFDLYFGDRCLTSIITDTMQLEILSADGAKKLATVSTGAYFTPTAAEAIFADIYGYYT